MLFRLIGTLLVMAGSVGIGFYLSAKESFRIQDLLEFKKALLILSSEIEYMRSTLAEACANIAKRTSQGISPIFANFSKLLTESEGETAYQLWLTAMDEGKESIFLAAEDRAVMEDFGKTLGYLDKQMQKNAIDYAVTYIDEKSTALQKQSDKNKRMYQSLGVIGGMLITVVLW
ncbi:MAG: stage III sporulation protein AB [Defluviitaleaceae bacterium]|nr:stage III sporulation protein AB [Defluviitaleaceae bacterium]